MSSPTSAMSLGDGVRGIIISRWRASTSVSIAVFEPISGIVFPTIGSVLEVKYSNNSAIPAPNPARRSDDLLMETVSSLVSGRRKVREDCPTLLHVIILDLSLTSQKAHRFFGLLNVGVDIVVLSADTSQS